MMEAKIQKQIIDFFSFFEEFYNTSKTCLKACQTCAVAINKLILRCRNIQDAQIVGTPLEPFGDIQQKVLSALHAQIHEAIGDIQDQQIILDTSLVKLGNKYNTLADSCKDIDFTTKTPLVYGTPLQPPLKRILEFAFHALTYGTQTISQIYTTLKILELRRLNTEPLVDNLKIPLYWEKKIHEILSYTSFCSENEI